MKKYTKWEEFPREDLKTIPLAIELGYTPVFSDTDKSYKRTTPDNCPHDAMSFEKIFDKGRIVIWAASRIIRAEVIDGRYTNHLRFDTYEEALKFEPVKSTKNN